MDEDPYNCWCGNYCEDIDCLPPWRKKPIIKIPLTKPDWTTNLQQMHLTEEDGISVQNIQETATEMNEKRATAFCGQHFKNEQYCALCDLSVTEFIKKHSRCNQALTQELDMTFETKDSGERQEFSTGMKRDTQTNKPRYDLLDRPMLKRWAELMARGALKYGENNWKKAATQEELNRFEASAIRHLFQWLEGETSEDHAAAVMFNISGGEMVKEKLKSKPMDIRQG